MDKLRTLIADFVAWFLSRSERERKLLVVCASAVLLFVLFLTFFSFANTASSTRRRTEYKETQLRQVEDLAASYNQAQSKREMAEQQLSRNNVQLISYLEEKGTAAGLDIPTINPKGDVPIGDGSIIESSVELTLTDVQLGKLVDFLSSVERGPGIVKVKYLRLEPRPADQVLTAWATIATYKLKASP